ncbi:Helix-turn-helix domain-containing protein [Paenibacillus sp. 1_12]|uniref:helix-turn-helix domain-containing protein n=1 Tax=Paenibacillus sp. 1_12 TaxID=1566278 RepID=UPI0008EE94ED|nr:helix-turn-helix domain-containing protein [Paenibacillus sp. 1_12]SFL16447.1 Helix-turn-helix domain-containing protein [Paenibacillus sp. 1_12]
MFRFNTYLTKMIVFTIGVSTLPIIMLGLFFYMKTSETIQEKVNAGNVLILEQTRLRVEQILTVLDLQIERLADTSYVTEALESGIVPSQFILVQNLLSSMSRVQTFDVGVQDIHLINLKKRWILNSGGLNSLTAVEPKISRYLHIKRDKFWIAENESLLRAGNSETNPTIKLIKKIPAFSENPDGLFIVEIPGKQLRSYLSADNTLGEVMILDESYRILASQKDNKLLDPQMLDTLIAELHQSSASSGLYETNYGKNQVGVAFQRSSFNGWIYISVIPIELIRLESRKTGWIILATCVIMLLLAVVISLAGSQRMYAPIQRLYQSLFTNQDKERKRIDEFHMINEGFVRMRTVQVQMADQIKNHMRQLEEYYVLKLVRGDITPSEMNERLGQLDANSNKWKRMGVLTIKIDTLKGTRYSESDSELLLFAISNMVGELIPAHNRLMPIVVQSSQVTLIFDDPKSTEEFRTYMYAMAKKIQDEVGNYLSLRISVGISRSYGGLKDANRAYKEAMDALKYRVLFGQQTILHIDDVQPAHNVTTEYPKELERQIFDAIKMADREKIQSLLDPFFVEISGQYHNYNDYQIAVTRFFVNLIRLLQESGVSHLELLGGDPPLMEQLHALSSVEDARNWFQSQIIEPVVSVYEDQRKTKYQTISQEVVRMIHDRYDTDISLEACSNMLNYHPSYISKVLRQELGISFSDYLMQYRLNKAKTMLEDTEMKISEIAEKLRYNNSQNFIRSFRKLAGMTPGTYRAQFIEQQYRARKF